jgi:hypothetical protein
MLVGAISSENVAVMFAAGSTPVALRCSRSTRKARSACWRWEPVSSPPGYRKISIYRPNP